MPDIQDMNPAARQAYLAAIAEAHEKGLSPHLNSAYRSVAEQQRLWDNRANNPNPVAPPGKSNHQSGLATDITEKGGKQAELAQIMAKHGFRWTMPDKDPVHFDYVGPHGGNLNLPTEQPGTSSDQLALPSESKSTPFDVSQYLNLPQQQPDILSRLQGLGMNPDLLKSVGLNTDALSRLGMDIAPTDQPPTTIDQQNQIQQQAMAPTTQPVEPGSFFTGPDAAPPEPPTAGATGLDWLKQTFSPLHRLLTWGSQPNYDLPDAGMDALRSIGIPFQLAGRGLEDVGLGAIPNTINRASNAALGAAGGLVEGIKGVYQGVAPFIYDAVTGDHEGAKEQEDQWVAQNSRGYDVNGQPGAPSGLTGLPDVLNQTGNMFGDVMSKVEAGAAQGWSGVGQPGALVSKALAGSGLEKSKWIKLFDMATDFAVLHAATKATAPIFTTPFAAAGEMVANKLTNIADNPGESTLGIANATLAKPINKMFNLGTKWNQVQEMTKEEMQPFSEANKGVERVIRATKAFTQKFQKDPTIQTQGNFYEGTPTAAAHSPDVNLLDAAIKAYVEAGSEGSDFQTRADVQTYAQKRFGLPGDLVARLGNQAAELGRQSGQAAVDAGLMDPEVFAKNEGYWVKRFYKVFNGNEEDVQSFRDELEASGGLTPATDEFLKNMRFSTKLGGKGAGISGKINPGLIKERTVTDAEEAANYAPVDSWSYSAKNSIPAQHYASALARVAQRVAGDPELSAAYIGSIPDAMAKFSRAAGSEQTPILNKEKGELGKQAKQHLDTLNRLQRVVDASGKYLDNGKQVLQSAHDALLSHLLNEPQEPTPPVEGPVLSSGTAPLEPHEMTKASFVAKHGTDTSLLGSQGLSPLAQPGEPGYRFHEGADGNHAIIVRNTEGNPVASLDFQSPGEALGVNKVASINGIFVDPAYRRRGIATQMKKALTEDLGYEMQPLQDRVLSPEGAALYHADAVKQALADNKPVPLAVLKDYPNLVEKPNLLGRDYHLADIEGKNPAGVKSAYGKNYSGQSFIIDSRKIENRINDAVAAQDNVEYGQQLNKWAKATDEWDAQTAGKHKAVDEAQAEFARRQAKVQAVKAKQNAVQAAYDKAQRRTDLLNGAPASPIHAEDALRDVEADLGYKIDPKLRWGLRDAWVKAWNQGYDIFSPANNGPAPEVPPYLDPRVISEINSGHNPAIAIATDPDISTVDEATAKQQGWTRAPSKPQYGAMAGQWVPQQILDFYDAVTDPKRFANAAGDNAFDNTFGALTKAWKFVTAYSNPITKTRITISALLDAQMAAKTLGLGLDFKGYLEGRKMWAQALKSGEDNPVSEAMMLTHQNTVGYNEGGYQDFDPLLGNKADTLKGKVGEYIRNTKQGFIDIHTERKAGLINMLLKAVDADGKPRFTPQTAAAAADNWYGSSSPLGGPGLQSLGAQEVLQMADKTGLAPFTAWPVHLATRFYHILGTQPELAMMYPNIRRALMNQASKRTQQADDRSELPLGALPIPGDVSGGGYNRMLNPPFMGQFSEPASEFGGIVKPGSEGFLGAIAQGLGAFVDANSKNREGATNPTDTRTAVMQKALEGIIPQYRYASNLVRGAEGVSRSPGKHDPTSVFTEAARTLGATADYPETREGNYGLVPVKQGRSDFLTRQSEAYSDPSSGLKPEDMSGSIPNEWDFYKLKGAMGAAQKNLRELLSRDDITDQQSHTMIRRQLDWMISLRKALSTKADNMTPYGGQQ